MNDLQHRIRSWILVALFGLSVGLFPQAGFAAETAPHADVNITVSSIDVKPGGIIEVPVLVDTILPIESFRLTLKLSKDVTIYGKRTLGTLTDSSSIEQKVTVNGDGTNTWSLSAASSGTVPFIVTGQGTLITLLFQKDSISADIDYPISVIRSGEFKSRINEYDEAQYQFTDGRIGLHMINVAGLVKTWDSKPVSSAIALSSPTYAPFQKNTGSNVNDYSFYLGEVHDWTLSVTKDLSTLNADAPNTDTELDAVYVLKDSVGTFDCPVDVGDVTGSGEVTPQDATELLRYSLGDATFVPAATIAIQQTDFPALHEDRISNVRATFLGDCTGNSNWDGPIVAAASVSTSTLPSIVVDGSTLTLHFPDALSTRFSIDGLAPKSIAGIAMISETVQAAALQDYVFNDVKITQSGQEGSIIGARGTLVAAGKTTPGITVRIQLLSEVTDPVHFTISGRIGEEPVHQLGEGDIVPAEWHQLFMPLVRR